jgi:hypothetical protein
MIDTSRIPAELKARRQWVGWKEELRNGKPTKPPYSAVTGGLASHSSPATWASFDEVAAFEQRHAAIDGVGFVFTGDDEYAGVDLDKCRDPATGEIAAWGQAIIDRLNSYTETSPTGTGVHIIVCGRVPGGVKRGGVEIYDRQRYFTVTGQHLVGTPMTIERRYAELTELYQETTPPKEPTGRSQSNGVLPAVNIDDATLLDKARRSDKALRFTGLYDRGDWSSLGYESQSSADLALCSDLVFWTNRDPARTDALFRSSALMRPKWNEIHYGDGRTYGHATIEKALEGASNGYQPAPLVIDASTYEAVCTVSASETAVTEAEYQTPAAAGSFIAEYVAYGSMRTDAPPQAHELMAVGILSALAGPRPRLRIATHVNGWPLNVWAMYVVDSTVGRKSTVLGFAIDIVESVLTTAAIIPWEGSPQGIIQRLQERDGQAAVFVRDEYSGLMQQMKRGGHMAGLEQVFIRAYDGGVIENIRTRKKTSRKDPDGAPIYEKDVDRVERPYLVKLCASTRTALVERCSIDDVISGFLPRFVFMSGNAVPRPLTVASSELAKRRDAIVLHARAFHEKASRLDTIPISKEVLEQQWALEQAWVRRAEDMARPEAAAASLKRLSETVLKTAALIAIDEARTGDPVVDGRHFSQAYLLAERWVEDTLGIIEELGATSFMRDTEAVRTSIVRKPGISMAELLRHHRRLRKKDFDEILQTLEQREQIQKRQLENTGGRPREVFFPVLDEITTG